MSLRSTSLRSLRSAHSPLRALPIRSLQSSPSRRADHSGHDHSNPNDRQYETRETWFAGPSRNFIIASLIAYFAWPYIPEGPNVVASPASDPEAWAKLCQDETVPWYTRWIAQQFTPREVNDKATEDKIRQAAYTATGRMLIWDQKGDALTSTQGSRRQEPSSQA